MNAKYKWFYLEEKMENRKNYSKNLNKLVENKEKFITYSLYCLFICFAILYLYTFYSFYEISMSSDSAGTILNAVMAFREKTFIPSDFNYTSVVGFQSHTILIPIILLFTSNVMLAFFISNIIMISLTLFIAYKLLLVLNISKNWRIIFLIILLLPLNKTIIDLQIISQFYLIQLAGIYLSLYLLFKCENASNKKIILLSVIAFTHAFLQSLNGMRFISYFTLPFAASFVFYCWLIYHQNGWEAFKNKTFKARSSIGLSTIIGAGSGLLYFLLKIKKEVSTYNFSLITENDSALWSQKLWDAFIDSIYGFFRLTGGVYGGEELSSIAGILTTIAFGFSVFLIWIFLKCFFDLNKWSIQENFIIIFTAFSFLINKFLNIVLKETSSTARYDYLTFYVLLIVPIFCICKYPSILEYIKKSFIHFCFIALAGIYLLSSPLQIIGNKDAANYRVEQLQEATKWLSEQNCVFGYATYWNANRATVLSNLQVEFAAISPATELLSSGFYPWFGGMPRIYYKDDYHEGQTAIILTKEESEMAIDTLPQNYIDKYSNDLYDVYCYAEDPFNFEQELYQYYTLPSEIGYLENKT